MPRGDSVQSSGDMPVRPGLHVAGALSLDVDELIWLVGSICHLSGAAFDARLVRQRTAAPCDWATLIAILAELGFDTRAEDHVHPIDLAIATLVLAADARPAPVLVVRASEERVEFFRVCDTQACALSPQEFAQRRAGLCLCARLRIAAPSDEDALAARRPFGFSWFVPELLKHRRVWRDVLLASAAMQVLALGLPLMTQAIIDKVIVHRAESTLIALGTGLALFALFSAVLTWVRQYLVLHTGTRIDAVLGGAVFKHLVELPPRYFQHRPTGVIAARLQGVEQIREFLSSAGVALLLDVPFLALCLAVMFVYSTPLSLLALAFLAALVAGSLAMSPLFHARLNVEFLLAARNQAFVTEYVAGIETVKSLQMEPALIRRFGDYLAAHLAAAFATRRIGGGYQVAAGALEQTMTLSILIFGAWIAMQPHAGADAVFTIGMLVAFQMFASRLSQPLLRLVGLWQQFQQAHLAVRRLGDLMNAPAEPYSLQPKRARAAADATLIRFEALTFRYGEDRRHLFERLDLAIRAGECVAVVGPSGCGKSTLVKLLQGFYLPTEGRVLVDGIDARHLAANELRATFGVVPQETVLFAGTVLDNLRLADQNASFERVVEACRLAEIHATIERLPQGYQTPIGERGSGLSGGQKQRIAIARALLKRPRVLIFDEATSNLDAETAAAFARTLMALRGRVTILVVTHAPIAAMTFDRVIRLGG